MSYSANKRKKDAASVLNKVDLVSNALPMSADNLPVGLVEDKANTKSWNIGTDRPLLNGGSYIFNATSYIEVIANNGDISSVSALDETGAIVSLTPTYSVDRYNITGVDGNVYWNIKCWGNGVTPTDAQKKAFTLAESVESDLYTWWKTEEGSGDNVVKAYSDGVDGSIINLYAGFHGTQDVYSSRDEDGYSSYTTIVDSNGTDIIPSLSPTDTLEYTITNASSSTGFFTMLGNTSVFIGAGDDGGSANISSINSSLYVDDVLFTGNQGDLYNLLTTGNTFKIKVILNVVANNLSIMNSSHVAYKMSCYISEVIHKNALGEIQGTYLSNGDLFIPKDESITLPPFKDVLGNDLQYVGAAPSRASFVESPCFQGDKNAGLLLDSPIVLSGDFNIEFYYKHSSVSASENAYIFGGTGGSVAGYRFVFGNDFKFRDDAGTSWNQITDGSLFFDGVLYKMQIKRENGNHSVIRDGADISGADNPTTTFTLGEIFSRSGTSIIASSIFDLKITANGISYYWPMPFEITDFANHTYFDVSDTAGVPNGNHAKGVNLSTANNGIVEKPDGDYGQLGKSDTISTDGVDDMLDTLYFPQPDTKITVWAKFNNYPNTENYLLGYQDAGAPRIQFGVILGKWFARWGNATYQSEDADTNWHKFELTKSALKIDDVTIYTISGDDPIGPPVNPLFLFARNSSVFGQNHVNVEFDRCLIEESSTAILDFRTKLDLIEDVLTGALYNNIGDVFANGQPIPALASDLTKDALGNPLTVIQDNAFLDTGTKLAHVKTPRLLQAEKINRFWTDANGDIISVASSDFNGAETGKQDYNDISEPNKVKNTRKHKKALNDLHDKTEKIITNN